MLSTRGYAEGGSALQAGSFASQMHGLERAAKGITHLRPLFKHGSLAGGTQLLTEAAKFLIRRVTYAVPEARYPPHPAWRSMDEPLQPTLAQSPGGRPTVLASLCRGTIEAAVAQGADREALLRAGRLTTAMLDDPDARVPVQHSVQLWQEALAQTADPYLGLRVADYHRPEAFNVLGYLSLSGSTLREGAERWQRFSSLVNDESAFWLREDDPHAAFVWEPGPALEPVLRELEQVSTVSAVKLMRLAAGPEFRPEAVHMRHTPPGDPAPYVERLHAPVHFGQPETRIVFAREWLDRPTLTANPGLARLLAHYAEQALAQFNSRNGGFLQQVQREIARTLGEGEVGLERIAAVLGVSPRTLQRRLKEEATTFYDVLDGVRHDLSMQYLRQRELAISEVAFLLGFSEASAFYRAFRRWTGETPAAFRRRVAGMPDTA